MRHPSNIAARIERDKVRFLGALRDVYSLSGASRKTGIGRTTVYEWRQTDAAFDAGVEDARVAAVEDLEASTFELAKAGTQPQHVTLKIFLLKSLKRAVYGERIAHTGDQGGPVRIEEINKLRKLPPDRLALLKELREELDRLG